MRNNNRVNVVVRQQPAAEVQKNVFERNQGLIQFSSVILTLAALLITFYFSNQSTRISQEQLVQSKKQLDQSDSQLKLAQEQFRVSLKQRTADSLEKYNEDSVQNARFQVQNEINLKNLTAIQLQARVAKRQFESQSSLNKEVEFQNRPIFVLLSTSFDTLINTASFTIQNVGKRPVSLYSSQFMSYNSKLNKISDNGLQEETTEMSDIAITTFSIQISGFEYKDPNQVYHLFFVYRDIDKDATKTFEKYFIWKTLKDGKIGWANADISFINLMKNSIRQREINNVRRLRRIIK